MIFWYTLGFFEAKSDQAVCIQEELDNDQDGIL